MKYKDNMPQLGRLALLLTHIPASADFIERFFSICGIIKDKKRQYEFWFIRSTLSFKIESWFFRKCKKNNQKHSKSFEIVRNWFSFCKDYLIQNVYQYYGKSFDIVRDAWRDNRDRDRDNYCDHDRHHCYSKSFVFVPSPWPFPIDLVLQFFNNL